MSSHNWINLVNKDENFKYLTKLVISKLSGGLVSTYPPNDFRKELAFLIIVIYSFECPRCETFIQIKKIKQKYNCDCGITINLENLEYEERYLLNGDFYQRILNFFQQEFSLGYNKYIFVFGERNKKELLHDRRIYIHITPKDIWTQDIEILDKKYIDNFAIGWIYVLDLFNWKTRTQILARIENIREFYVTENLYQRENKNLFLKENTINFLHISDFHVEGNASDNEKEIIIQSLINDLKKRVLKDNSVDCVLISGDITQSAEFDQFEKVNKILIENLEDSIDGLSVNRQNIYVVPGNHDIDRKFFNKDVFDSLTKEYNEESLKKFWYERNEESALFYNFKKLLNFQLFQKKILNQEPIEADKLYLFKKIEKKGFKIGILGLNTVWVGGDKIEKGNLLLSKYQIYDAFSESYNYKDFDLRLAFFHHPIESLNEEEQDEIKSLLYNYFHLVLFGHRHDTNYSLIKGYKTDTHLIRAGPIYKSSRKIRGSYNLIQIDVNYKIGRIIYRKPHKNNLELYVCDNEASPKEEFIENNGTFKILLNNKIS